MAVARPAIVAVCIQLLLLPLLARAADTGVLYLDDLTFDRVVDGKRDVLVRFDKEYPWGDAHDAFKKAAKDISSSAAPCLVAGVPISNSKDYPVNTQLAARFQLTEATDSTWPVFKLFKAGGDVTKPLDWPAGKTVTADTLINWVVSETGAFIAAKGQVEALHTLAQQFMAEGGAAGRRAQLEAGKKAADAAAAANAGHKPYVEYYVKTMQRVLDKGTAYVEQEAERLRRVMKNDKSITPDKRSTFEWRLNVLASFTAPTATNTEL